MALFRPVQVQSSRAPVIAGGVPPSGNAPVFSPFTGPARPRIPLGLGSGSVGLQPPGSVTGGKAGSPTLPFASPNVGAPVFHPAPSGRRPSYQ